MIKSIEVKEIVKKDAQNTPVVNDTPVENEKIVEEKLNTISASVNDSDKIDDENNFVADDKSIEVNNKNNFVANDKSIEVKEIIKKDAKNTPVVNDIPVENEKIVEEKLNTISASVNDSDKEVKKMMKRMKMIS